MMTVSVHDAKTHLSSILMDIERSGETVVICRYNKAVAQITPITRRERIKTNPEISDIKIKCDLTEPTAGEWSDA